MVPWHLFAETAVFTANLLCEGAFVTRRTNRCAKKKKKNSHTHTYRYIHGKLFRSFSYPKVPNYSRLDSNPVYLKEPIDFMSM